MTVARIALAAPVEVIEPTDLTDTIRQLATHLTVTPQRRAAECVDPIAP